MPLEFKPVGKEAQKFQVVKPYDPARSAMVSAKGGSYLGIIGEFKPSVTRQLKLPRYCAGFEIDTTALLQLEGRGVNYEPLSRFPAVKQDITLRVDAGLDYARLYGLVHERVKEDAPEDTRVHVGPVDIYEKAGSKHKNVTFRVSVAAFNRTLTDKEVAAMLDKVAADAKVRAQSREGMIRSRLLLAGAGFLALMIWSFASAVRSMLMSTTSLLPSSWPMRRSAGPTRRANSI